MSVLGIGPILFVAGAVPLALVLVTQFRWEISVPLPTPWNFIFLALGIILCAVGAIFWFGSAIPVEKAFRAHRLVTSGVFRLSRNPLYTAFIVFIAPGAAFIANNLLLLIVAPVMFVVFKLQIGKEEEYLRQEFGDDYLDYEAEVPQLIPFVRI